MNKYIVLEFGGWAKIDPKNARFISVKTNDDPLYSVIDGETWLALDTNERAWYILEDAIAFQRDSIDGEYSSLDLQIVTEGDE